MLDFLGIPKSPGDGKKMGGGKAEAPSRRAEMDVSSSVAFAWTTALSLILLSNSSLI